jgi:arabinofuranosyltransferase
MAVYDDPVYVAVVLGTALTATTVTLLAQTLVGRAREPLTGLAVAAAVTLLWLGSEAWLSFQTSGLENSLSHLLIVMLAVEVTRTGGPRPLPATLVTGLLFLCRPDFAALTAPLALVLLVTAMAVPGVTGGRRLAATGRGLLPLAAGAAPVLAWEVFSLSYYGEVLPNTAGAKLGVYSSLSDGASQGVEYLKDWANHEPFAVAAAAVSLLTTIALTRTRYEAALLVGIAIYLGAVIVAGGDFMRGRLFLPLLVAVSALAALLLVQRAPEELRRAPPAVAMLVVVATAFWYSHETAPRPDDTVSEAGIVNERMFYPDYHLDAYRRNGGFVNSRYGLELPQRLRDYAEACGPVAIHSPTPGTFGYISGPKVTYIDMLGLLDRFIANLPREYLVDDHPRPGHPHKRIPLSYLAGKADIAILNGWWDAVERKECDFPSKTARYRDSTLLYEEGTGLDP